jgi:hypothetical protein
MLLASGLAAVEASRYLAVSSNAACLVGDKQDLGALLSGIAHGDIYQ